MWLSHLRCSETVGETGIGVQSLEVVGGTKEEKIRSFVLIPSGYDKFPSLSGLKGKREKKKRFKRRERLQGGGGGLFW